MKNIFKTFFFLSLLFSQNTLLAQAAINTTGNNPHPSAMLEVTSTAKGLLTPRMTSAQRAAIGSPATGLLVYQTDETMGFYYFDGTNWTSISSSSKKVSINNADASTLGLSYLSQSKTAANNNPAFRFVSDKGYFIDIDYLHQLGTSWISYSNADCTGTAYATPVFYGPGATFASPKDGALHYIAQNATTTAATINSRYIVGSNTCQAYSPGSATYYPLTPNNAATTGINLTAGTAYKVTFE